MHTLSDLQPPFLFRLRLQTNQKNSVRTADWDGATMQSCMPWLIKPPAPVAAAAAAPVPFAEKPPQAATAAPAPLKLKIKKAARDEAAGPKTKKKRAAKVSGTAHGTNEKRGVIQAHAGSNGCLAGDV